MLLLMIKSKIDKAKVFLNGEWHGTHYLRAFIYRSDEEDMTVNDCAMVSRRLSKWLDKEDFIEEEYILEVCSLGFKDNPSGESEDWDSEIEEATEDTEE